MKLREGATTDQLLAEGYSVERYGRWMRRDSSWMVMCESCGLWFSMLADPRLCSHCRAELYCDENETCLPEHRLQGFFWRMLFLIALLAALIAVMIVAALIE